MTEDQVKPKKDATADRETNLPTWWAALLPVFVGSALFVGAILYIGQDPTDDVWAKVAVLGASALIALLFASGMRVILSPLVKPRPVTRPQAVDPLEHGRSRIAPIVLMLGGAALVVLTLTLVVAFVILVSGVTDDNHIFSGLANKIDTVLMGIFGAVLPILATWVGTVIAFYFTNESYREAARAVGAPGATRSEGPRVTSIMVPYERIPQIPVDTRSEADSVKYSEIKKKLGSDRTRLVIMETPAKNPVYVIRKKMIPGGIPAGQGGESTSLVDATTVAQLRAVAEFGKDSKKYGFVSEVDTITAAKRKMQDSDLEDIFVTKSGQQTEEVLGWVTADMVKGF